MKNTILVLHKEGTMVSYVAIKTIDLNVELQLKEGDTIKLSNGKYYTVVDIFVELVKDSVPVKRFLVTEREAKGYLKIY